MNSALLVVASLGFVSVVLASPSPEDIFKFKESDLNFLPPDTPEYVKDMIRNWTPDRRYEPRCVPPKPRYAVEWVNPPQHVLDEQKRKREQRKH